LPRQSFDQLLTTVNTTVPGDENMRFLSMIRIDEGAGQVPSEQLMDDMGKLIAEMTAQGVLIRTAGLRPTKEGRRVRLHNGGLSTVDGPFTETKEVIGGFAILEAPSMGAAVELTKRFLRVHGDAWEIECEVRQIEGPEFGSDSNQATAAGQVVPGT
jgi:hypothetical protein